MAAATTAPKIKIDSPAGKPPLKPGKGGKGEAPAFSLPRRAAPHEHHSANTPELNDYIKARLPKGEVRSCSPLLPKACQTAAAAVSFPTGVLSLGLGFALPKATACLL